MQSPQLIARDLFQSFRMGSRRRRNDQRIDAGGGKRDRADQPSRPGADNRDFSGEGGIHTDSGTTGLRIPAPIENA